MGLPELSRDGALAILPIHFDLPAHAIPLGTFVRTAQQAEAIIRSLNKELFDGKLKYEILVLPPQEGTFLTKLGIYLVGSAWIAVVWTILESDIGKGFIQGLTTHEPAYWAEQAGEAIREMIVSEDDLESVEDISEQTKDDETKCFAAANILVEAIISFLQKDAAELESIGITTTRFRDSFAARNEFYEACIEVPEIRAVGFEDKPVFPIKRSDFTRLQIPLSPEKDENDQPWITGIVDLKVTSPNWEKEDRQRSWKGKNAQGQERHFRIEDEHFWGLVKAKKLNTHIIDTIKVQWAFQEKDKKPKNFRVLRVLEFNGDILSKALDDNALSAILGDFSNIEDDQTDLFTYLDNPKE